MKAMKLALAAATAAVALVGAGAASAQEMSVSYNIGVFSDYVFRGVSQTQNDPALQGGVDVSYGQFYVGTWASNVDFGGPNPDAEIDLYGGFKPTVGDTSFDFGVLYYGYVKDKNGAPGANSYMELKAAVAHPVGKATVGAAFYYSPEYSGNSGYATYYELNAALPIADKLTLSGAVGSQKYDKIGTYATWNVGATYALTDKLALDLRYADTDAHSWGKVYDSRVFASLKATF
jgi:uncharacterized protein (TIGR02001 family)